jgi:hypothetical protein
VKGLWVSVGSLDEVRAIDSEGKRMAKVNAALEGLHE